MEFKASYLDIQPHELVRHLLFESGQHDCDAVDPPKILELLGLRHVSFDFRSRLPEEMQKNKVQPRALVSFPDRVVATDTGLKEQRARFSVLHEVAHYVLPNHQRSLYVCDERGLSYWARLGFEREANQFAADLLFHGNRFTLEVNSHSISAATVVLLAEKYRASFEATARRLVERNFRPCMLIVFEEKYTRPPISLDVQSAWCKKYTVASPAFKATHFADIASAVVPAEVVAEVSVRGISDGYVYDLRVRDPAGKRQPFRGEFFSNQHNIFCLLTPH